MLVADAGLALLLVGIGIAGTAGIALHWAPGGHPADWLGLRPRRPGRAGAGGPPPLADRRPRRHHAGRVDLSGARLPLWPDPVVAPGRRLHRRAATGRPGGRSSRRWSRSGVAVAHRAGPWGRARAGRHRAGVGLGRGAVRGRHHRAVQPGERGPGPRRVGPPARRLRTAPGRPGGPRRRRPRAVRDPACRPRSRCICCPASPIRRSPRSPPSAGPAGRPSTNCGSPSPWSAATTPARRCPGWPGSTPWSPAPPTAAYRCGSRRSARPARCPTRSIWPPTGSCRSH